jgi:peroxiredoxin
VSEAAQPSLPRQGTQAPDFTLPATSGTDVILSKLRGKNVLLAFFPLAFTRVCTQEMCSSSEDYGRFRDANTVVLPISVDSIPTLREFKAKEPISVDLLSDFKREVSRRYGTLIEEMFFSNRAYVLIDPAGKVLWAFSEETPGSRRENEELLAQLEAHRPSA